MFNLGGYRNKQSIKLIFLFYFILYSWNIDFYVLLIKIPIKKSIDESL